jgi:hypothetical protein
MFAGNRPDYKAASGGSTHARPVKVENPAAPGVLRFKNDEP